MRQYLIWLHEQILMTRQRSLILIKMQECWLKNCTVHVHGFFAPKLDWHLQKLGRMCCNSEEIGRKNALALPQSLRLHALTSPDRIQGLF